MELDPSSSSPTAANGSNADCDDKLSTEPQLIGRVQSVSSPKPLSASECGLDPPPFVLPMVRLPLPPLPGNGVALPDAVSLSGLRSYEGRESLKGINGVRMEEGDEELEAGACCCCAPDRLGPNEKPETLSKPVLLLLLLLLVIVVIEDELPLLLLPIEDPVADPAELFVP